MSDVALERTDIGLFHACSALSAHAHVDIPFQCLLCDLELYKQIVRLGCRWSDIIHNQQWINLTPKFALEEVIRYYPGHSIHEMVGIASGWKRREPLYIGKVLCHLSSSVNTLKEMLN